MRQQPGGQSGFGAGTGGSTMDVGKATSGRPDSVSVIAPLWNPGGQLLPLLARLDRLAETGCEIIVVDDASTDGSLPDLERWSRGHANVVLLVNDCNVGVAASRNVALTKATREFVWFVDHDDD